MSSASWCCDCGGGTSIACMHVLLFGGLGCVQQEALAPLKNTTSEAKQASRPSASPP
jgi:hypothetical protein